jgi:hypothetical protein
MRFRNVGQLATMPRATRSAKRNQTVIGNPPKNQKNRERINSQLLPLVAKKNYLQQ